PAAIANKRQYARAWRHAPSWVISSGDCDSLQVTSPPTQRSNIPSALSRVGLTDKAGHPTSVLQFDLADGEGRRNCIHKTAKLGRGNGPHLDLDGGSSACHSNQARAVRRPAGQRVQGVHRIRPRPAKKPCAATRQLMIEG